MEPDEVTIMAYVYDPRFTGRTLSEQIAIAAKTGVSEMLADAVTTFDDDINAYDVDSDIRVSRMDKAEMAFAAAEEKRAAAIRERSAEEAAQRNPVVDNASAAGTESGGAGA